MILKIKRSSLRIGIFSLILLFAVISVFIGVTLTSNYVSGANVTNVSVISRLNVTNTAPNVTAVIVDDDSNSPANEIDLVSYTTKRVHCNGTVVDFNGWQDIDADTVNATFFMTSVGHQAADDNNDHY